MNFKHDRFEQIVSRTARFGRVYRANPTLPPVAVAPIRQRTWQDVVKSEAKTSIGTKENIRECPNFKATSVTEDINRLLRAQGFTPQNASRVSETLAIHNTSEISLQISALEETFEELFTFDSTPLERGVHAFVGPTGVGKTTTIAKLAAHACLIQKRQVALITLDTQRVGATQQLQGFARSFDIPCHVAENTRQLSELLDQLENYDLVLMDTFGFGPRESERLELLVEQLDCGFHIQRHLLVPASSNTTDLDAILRCFITIAPNDLSVTKLDETFFFGPCLNSLLGANKALRFFTTGQSVPEDFEPASASKVVSMIVGRAHN